MTELVFEGDRVTLAVGESVLDGLLRSGHRIPYGCRAGACQACLLSADEAEPVAAAQQGLTSSQRQQRLFFACQCRPDRPLSVQRAPLANPSVEARVLEKTWLTPQILRLRLQASLDYRAGQYVTLWANNQLARSYSLASLPGRDGWLEFHIRRYPGGAFSGWLAERAMEDSVLLLQGPIGDCYYACGDQQADPDQPLLMAAVGTGLAPIWGILQDALAQGHRGSIDVVLGAREQRDFYYREELQALAVEHPQLQLHWLVMEPAETGGFTRQADIYDYCRQQFPDLRQHRVYLGGGQSFVSKLRKQCFLQGAAMAAIHADAFLPFAD